MSMTMHVIIDVLLAIGVFFCLCRRLGRHSYAGCLWQTAGLHLHPPAWAIFS